MSIKHLLHNYMSVSFLCKDLIAYGNSHVRVIMLQSSGRNANNDNNSLAVPNKHQIKFMCANNVFSGSQPKSKAIHIPAHGLCWRVAGGIFCGDKNVT